MVRYRTKKGRKLKRPSKEVFEMQYYDMEVPVEELARMYEVKPNTIYNWAQQFRKKEDPKLDPKLDPKPS